MNNFAKQAVLLAKKIKKDSPTRYVPPSEGTSPRSQMVLPHSIVRGTRPYIERITYQINGCYESGWYDGCAVMMRRLLETLIIEAFENNAISQRIKNANGDFFFLADLVAAAINETSWNLGRSAKRALPKLKEIGDQSAHSRRFIAHREDIEKLILEFRVVAQEFIFLAKLK